MFLYHIFLDYEGYYQMRSPTSVAEGEEEDSYNEIPVRYTSQNQNDQYTHVPKVCYQTIVGHDGWMKNKSIGNHAFPQE